MDNFCVVCGASELEVLANVDRHKRELTTVVCRKCGLVQHAIIPTTEELIQFYRSEYRVAYNGEDTPSDRRVYRDWLRGKQRFDALKSFVSTEATVFEIGSGIGCNLDHFRNHGCSVSGIEPGEGFSRYSRESMHLDVQCTALENVPEGSENDLVLLVHVLEHLPDPINSLERIRRMLKPNGVLYIEVPNFSIPHACPSKVFHYGHIFNFTPISLANVAHLAGFSVHSIRTESRASTNITVILKPDVGAKRKEIQNGYLQATVGFDRYSPISYRFRITKVRDGVMKVHHRLCETLFAKSTVANITSKPSAGIKSVGAV